MDDCLEGIIKMWGGPSTIPIYYSSLYRFRYQKLELTNQFEIILSKDVGFPGSF